MSDPDGWRDIDETQREEIARLRADAEYSFKRIASLEEENRRLRRALGNAGCVYCNASKRLDVLGDPTVGVSLSPDPSALSQEEKP